MNRLQKLSSRLARESSRRPPGRRADRPSLRLREGKWRKIAERLRRHPHRYDD